jgi:hypothetical protein
MSQFLLIKILFFMSIGNIKIINIYKLVIRIKIMIKIIIKIIKMSNKILENRIKVEK